MDKQIAEAREKWAEIEGATFPDPALVRELGYAVADDHAPELQDAIRECVDGLIAEEATSADAPDFEKLDLVGLARIPARVELWKYKIEHGQEDFDSVMLDIIAKVQSTTPQTVSPSPFTIPYIYTFPDAKLYITALCRWTFELRDKRIFYFFGDKLYANVCYASGNSPYDAKFKKPVVLPCDSNLPLDRINDAYLKGTPLHRLFATPVPLKLTHKDRFNHMHVLGGTGAGKTTLIESLIHHDLTSDDPPSIVVIDPHGDLIDRVARTDYGMSDRIIIIDPRDVENPPALNIFALNQERMKDYDEAAREQVVAGVIETYEYLFAGFGIEMTGKQQVLFRNACRVLIEIPNTPIGRNATILDMLWLMDDPVPYAPAIELLPDLPRQFFKRDFKEQSFKQTREQIRYRLQAIVENPTMARLFMSTDTKIDLFTELNRGAVILVDTAKDFLKGSSSLFGRLFISLILQAILERAVVKKANRKSTFFYIDEAASFFDSNISDMLNEVRKYNCGLVLAHQYLEQATPTLRSSLAANTAIKMASGTSANDARALATDMRTTAEFILDQPRYQFAAFIKTVTPQAISIPVKPVRDVVQLTDVEYDALREANRKRVSLGRPVTPRLPEVAIPEVEDAPTAKGEPKRKQKPRPQNTRIADEDVSKRW